MSYEPGTSTGGGVATEVIANAGTNLNTSALALESGGNLDTIDVQTLSAATNLASINAKTPAFGQATAANSVPVVLSSDGPFTNLTGAVNETAPVTDTASSGVNGRLQRIAQRLTSIITSLFSATSNSDALRLPVNEKDGLAVSGSVSSAAVLFTADMVDYNSITVQITSAGTSCTISYETSDDNVTWQLTAGYVSSSLGATAPATTSTTAILLQFPRKGRYFRARVSTYNSGTVTVVGTVSKTPVTNPVGTVFVQGFNPTINVAGPVAHGGGITNFPNRIAARAISALYTTLGNNITADLICTLAGALIQKPYSIPELDWNYAAASGGISNTTTAVTFKAAAGAGLRNYITGIDFSASALGVATEIAIRDGAAGTVLWRSVIGTAGLSGTSINFPSPIQGTANTLLEIVTLTATVTGAIYFNSRGYAAP